LLLSSHSEISALGHEILKKKSVYWLAF